MSDVARFGVIGGGLMGREIASALARWFALEEMSHRAELVAVCDLQPQAREWFRRVPTVELVTGDVEELLQTHLDVVYVAVPHQLHRDLYLQVLQAGKDLLAEKPFGIDLEAARAIADEAKRLERFVRCSSEFPFMPGAQRVWQMVQNENFGRILEIRAGFHHGSDLDPQKPANWKRQNVTCGEAGVLNDLGMHTVHLPFRLGWNPVRVYAQLQRGFEQRPDGRGGMALCDTWDNAMLHCDVEMDGREVPMRLEMKRLAPGESNSWFIEVLGTERGVKWSSKEVKTLWTFERQNGQAWSRVDVGHEMAFRTITGSIFEAGFNDCLLQMLASFVSERQSTLNGRLGCVRPDEAVRSHRLWQAALESQASKRAVSV